MPNPGTFKVGVGFCYFADGFAVLGDKELCIFDGDILRYIGGELLAGIQTYVIERLDLRFGACVNRADGEIHGAVVICLDFDACRVGYARNEEHLCAVLLYPRHYAVIEHIGIYRTLLLALVADDIAVAVLYGNADGTLDLCNYR